MKRNSLRRLGALVLALALTLSLVPTGWAADPADPAEVTLTATPGITATVGDTITLAATVDSSSNLTLDNLEASWTTNPAITNTDADIFKYDDVNSGKTTYVMKGLKAGEVKISVSYKDNTTGDVVAESAEVTVKWEDAGTSNPDPDPEPTVTINKPTSTTLGLGESITLRATTANVPTGATSTFAWAATLEDGTPADGLTLAPNDSSCTLTGKTEGTYKVKVTLTVGQGNDVKDYESTPVTLEVKRLAITGLTFNTDNAKVWGRDEPNPWDLTVYVIPAGADTKGQIVWEVRNKDQSDSRVIVRLPGQDKDPSNPDGKPLNTYTGDATVRLTSAAPGEVYVIAKCNDREARREVIVSGIVLNTESTTMLIGETKVLAVEKMYGFAESGNAADIMWSSSDPSTVTVVNGELQAWKLGTAIITANKNGYTATCKVEVTEDKEAVISGLSATASEPLTFDKLYDRLNEISQNKTGERDDEGNVIPGSGSPLHYITNVMVPVEQGTLYYNYDSESNTGAGVGATDRFVKERTASILETLDKLYYVPRQGFNGTAEITFVGWAKDGSSFSVTAKVEVQGSQGIRYKTTSGQPAYFQGSDFNAYCRARMGRDMSYVTFNLPQSGQGGLYYGYMAPGQYAGKVSTTTQYGRTGKNTIDDVCFVPSESFEGVVSVSFRGVDTAGKSFNGLVVINVAPPSTAGDKGNVYQNGQWGQPVKLEPSLFNSACQATIGDTLAYVRFQLPAYDKGTLYYNYQGGTGSRVSTDSRYYYSGTPGIGGVSFVPAGNDADRVSIHYTGYGEGGTSFTGTLYITLGEEERTNVLYSVSKGASVSFRASDFNNVALYQMGTSLEYVTFQFPTLSVDWGRLYYDYRGTNNYRLVSSITPYYRSPSNSWQQQLGLISFHAGTTAGSVTIPFTGYSAADSAGRRQSFQGTLVIQVGAVSPADVTLSGYSSSQIRLSSYGISAACRQVMDQDLSYIRITSLPEAEQGRLYYGYQGFKTGSEVKIGDRYYYMGWPSIDQLSFVPRGGYSGQAEITYIGYSRNGGEQVSGKIVLNISRAATTQLYNDMGRHGWAVDAVEFLSRDGTVQGVGNGRYNPTGQITKGDFALMLVRAFGFTASGTVSFNDVPADSYYAQAISVAHQLGIATGYNGYFEPRRALSRQEAMLMVYRALKADGNPLNNGLTADLSVYRDSWQIAAEARPALGALILMGVVEGDGNGTLRPLDQLNRAETASLMHRLMTL